MTAYATRLSILVVALAASLAIAACRDPAASVPQATVAAEGTAAAATEASGAPAEGTAAAEGTAVAAEGTATPAEGSAPADAAAPREIALSPANASVAFSASKITASHEGSFGQFTGVARVDPTAIGNSSVSVEIQMASVTTDNGRLTQHLLTDDFFAIEQFPTATFESTAITEADPANTPGGATHVITGTLTLRGQTRAISFPATVSLSEDAFVANAEFSINRQDFGIAYPGRPDDLIRDGVVLRLTVNAPLGG